MNPLSVSLSVLLIVSLTGVFFFSMPAQAIGDDEDGLPDSLTSGAKEIIKWLKDNLVDAVILGVWTVIERILEFIGSIFQWFMDLWVKILEAIRDTVIGLFDPYIEESESTWTQTADLVITTFFIFSLIFIVKIIKWVADWWIWILDVIPVV